MRKILPIILFAGIFFISCGKKTRNVHFEGRAYMQCDESAISNEEVQILVDFDAGHSATEVVATTTTDGNGNYSVIADVSYAGDFEALKATLTNQKYVGNIFLANATEKTHNVHLDLPCTVYSKSNIHIKNTQPVNASDMFSILCTSSDSNEISNCNYWNLSGTDVDTTITLKYLPGRIYYRYYFKKNGLEYSSPVLFFDAECNTDMNVDVFY